MKENPASSGYRIRRNPRKKTQKAIHYRQKEIPRFSWNLSMDKITGL